MKNERQLVAFALTYNFINKTYNYNGGGGGLIVLELFSDG